jgi:hypothetical protein
MRQQIIWPTERQIVWDSICLPEWMNFFAAFKPDRLCDRREQAIVLNAKELCWGRRLGNREDVQKVIAPPCDLGPEWRLNKFLMSGHVISSLVRNDPFKALHPIEEDGLELFKWHCIPDQCNGLRISSTVWNARSFVFSFDILKSQKSHEFRSGE